MFIFNTAEFQAQPKPLIVRQSSVNIPGMSLVALGLNAFGLAIFFYSEAAVREVILYLSPNVRSQPMSTGCAHGVQINFGDLIPFLTYEQNIKKLPA
jgi:hypothetical protein